MFAKLGMYLAISNAHVLGNGAHAWISFDTPVTAFKARKLKNVYFCKKIRGKNIAAVYLGK